MSDFKDYLARIEEVFIGLRGTPFVLSPADVQLIQSWHGRGVAAEVVEEALREVFERERAKAPDRKISSLKYCSFKVEEAWAERGRKRAGSWQREGEAFPVDALLESNLERLRSFLAFPPFLDPKGKLSARLIGQVEALRAKTADPEAVEAGLKKIQDTLTLAALKALPVEERDAIKEEIRSALEKDLAALSQSAALFLVRTILLDRARQRFGIPTLTLW